MNPIGIVICNYNKRDYVLDCIQSILESNIHNYDIYMVDNASTDGSIAAVQSRYGNQVTILANSDNLGGSGGFNTGIRVVLENGYDYIMCLDDDAQVDENAIRALYEYMEQHPDVGMAGSRVYHLQMPDYIQQCGLNIDFEHCNATTLYADTYEDGTLPSVIECDTVATCAVMVRCDAIRNTDVGIMPEDNFIYWDDMEWGHRMHLAGYKTVTLAASAALHQMGATVRKPTTFLNYYMWRNRTHFFMKYTPWEYIEPMSVQLLSGVFDALYESMFRNEHNIMQTISYAWQDALCGVRGKAEDHKILENDANDDKLTGYVRTKSSYYIRTDNSPEQTEEAAYLRKFIENANPSIQEAASEQEADAVFCMCPYIFHVTDLSLTYVYIDSERNCILTQEDALAVRNYSYSKMLFLYMNQGIFLDAVRKLREQ